MNKPKILFVIPWLPYPLLSGGHQALFNGIYSIKDYYDIYISYEAKDDDNYNLIKKGFLEEIPNAHLLPLLIKENPSKAEFPLWYRIASSLKWSVVKSFTNEKQAKKITREYNLSSSWINNISPLSKSWIEHITKICLENHFDIIQVEMPRLISQILTLPSDSKKIYVHHELGFVRRGLEQMQYPDSGYVKASKGLADIVEIGLLNMYDAVITLSAIDRYKLIKHGVKIPIFDSIAIVNMPKDIVCDKIDGKHLSFVGSSSHSPNLIGVTWFLENCWPSLQLKDHQYRLTVIGEWNKDIISEYTSKYVNIEFLGFVDNLAEYIKGTIMIVPITVGSGIRMKILEACSIGIPFVTTSVGAEGLPVEDGKNCYIADDPNSFVDKLVKLQDVSVQNSFIENACEMVRKKYSSIALRENRLEIYNRVLNQ